MTVREELERLEHKRLNPLAAFSDCSAGRPRQEPEREEDVRACYQRDTDRIVHSKAFRRLMHKTQVFLNPEGDHYRGRQGVQPPMLQTLQFFPYRHGNHSLFKAVCDV